MKALIVDIKKEYCVLITPDGRFLKKDIPAGSYEIGDEIIIEEKFAGTVTEEKKLKFGIFARIATGFAIAAILTTGVYFSVKYITTGTGNGPVVAAAEAVEPENLEGNIAMNAPQETFTAAGDNQETIQAQQDKSQEFSEQSTKQQEEASAAQSSDISMDPGLSLPILFESTYSLDESKDKINSFIPVLFESLDIKYMVEKYPVENAAEQSSPGILHLEVNNKAENTTFNGNITVKFLDEKDTVLDTRSFDFYEFIYGGTKLEKMYFDSGYVAFVLLITGEIK